MIARATPARTPRTAEAASRSRSARVKPGAEVVVIVCLLDQGGRVGLRQGRGVAAVAVPDLGHRPADRRAAALARGLPVPVQAKVAKSRIRLPVILRKSGRRIRKVTL